jgi:hypothetical protein
MKNLLILFTAILFLSCSKEEGYGGLAKITGKVYGKDINSSGNLVGEGYLGDVTVYISKSGETAYFDKVDSAYDGSFTFKFLHKGTYDIWAFGDCDNCSWDQNFTKKTITISSTKETVTTEDLVITF